MNTTSWFKSKAPSARNALKITTWGAFLLLGACLAKAQTTNSNSLTVLGYLDVTNNIDFGTTSSGTNPNSSAVLLNYTDTGGHIVEFGSTQPSSVFLWQDNLAGTARNKMQLDGNNDLVLINTNGSSGIFLNPNPNGGITLAGSQGITFNDGSTLYSASALTDYVNNGVRLNSGGALIAGDTSVTLGYGNNAGFYATAIGSENNASGIFSTALGGGNTASGIFSVALGGGSLAQGDFSLSAGNDNAAFGNSSIALGSGNRANPYSIALGDNTTAYGTFTTALGFHTYVAGNYSTAFGYGSSTWQPYATALGYISEAYGYSSTAFGTHSDADGTSSTAFGYYTTSIGSNSTAFGTATVANGYNATAFGISTYAQGDNATAFGIATRAASLGSVAFGQYNVGVATNTGTNTWISTDPVVEIGNGVSGSPSNAVTIFKSGEVRTAGNIQTQGSFRMPPAGDMSMGNFTNGNNPATLIPSQGLLYPGGN